MKLGLLGALGGLGEGVSAYGQQMTRGIDQQESDARQRSIEEWRLQKQEEYQIAREERAVATAEANAKRDADLRIKSREGAGAALEDRGFVDFKAKLGASDASDEQLREVYKTQYHDKTVGEFAGADMFDVKDSTRAREELRQLEGLGAGSGLLNTANAGVKDAVAQERQQEIAARQARLDANKEKFDSKRMELTDAQIAATTAKASGSGSGGGSRSSAGDDSPNLKNLKALHDIAIKERPKEPEAKVGSRTAREAAEQKHREALAAWEAEYGADVKAYRESLRGTPPAKSGATVKPVGGQSTKPPPAAGAVQNGYRFKGGDPSKQSNWEKVK